MRSKASFSGTMLVTKVTSLNVGMQANIPFIFVMTEFVNVCQRYVQGKSKWLCVHLNKMCFRSACS